jgi:CBS domain containing-hemolysin-like protein
MTRDPVAVSEDDDLATMVELMERRRVKRLPVLRNGKMVGIVSRANLMRALVSLAHSEEAPAGGDPALRERIVAAFAQRPWAPHVISWSKTRLLSCGAPSPTSASGKPVSSPPRMSPACAPCTIT